MSLSQIQTKIAASAEKAGRDPSLVKLIAISKVQPNARVQAVLGEGHRCFGENKVQEAVGKWPDFRTKFDGVELHLVGPLQSNKVKQAMELFDVIHTLDRSKLAARIARLRDELGRCPSRLLIQNDQTALMTYPLGDPQKMIWLKRNAALSREMWTAPTVNEDRRTSTGLRIGPIPSR